MEFLLFDSLRDTAYQPPVYEILKKCDREFVPPLSQRTSTTQKTLDSADPAEQGEPKSYFQKLREQSVILAVDQDQVLGFMSFLGRYTCEDIGDQADTIYVSTVIVDPPHRGRGLTLAMYRRLMDLAQVRGLPISTRTWSTNHAHIQILSQLGFYELFRIRDGRGPGIDTVYFRKD